MNDVSRNIATLLWKRDPSRKTWIELLANWLGCSPEYAVSVLSGRKPSSDDISKIADACRIDPADLQYQNLLDVFGIDIFRENLRRMVAALERGGKKNIAEKIGVERFTLSRWLAGTHRPPAAKMEKLKELLQIDQDTDLVTTPLFLATDPINTVERKKWLHQQIDGLESNELGEIFYALKKLLV